MNNIAFLAFRYFYLIGFLLFSSSVCNAGALDVTKFVWDIVKDGAKVDVSTKHVNAIPTGASLADFTWQGPVVFQEVYEKKSWLGYDMVKFTMTVSWQYDGNYIANFTVDPDGFVDLSENVNISVETLDATINSDGVAELPYRIYFKERHALSGSKMVVYKGVAYGNGGGRGGF